MNSVLCQPLADLLGHRQYIHKQCCTGGDVRGQLLSVAGRRLSWTHIPKEYSQYSLHMV